MLNRPIPCGQDSRLAEPFYSIKWPLVIIDRHPSSLASPYNHPLTLNVLFVPMHYLFATSLLAALGLPFSVIATSTCTSFTSCAWFENWGNFTTSEIPWDMYNQINYGFVSVSFHDLIPSLVWYPSCSTPTIDCSLDNSETLSTFVSDVHAHVRMLTRNEFKSNDNYRNLKQCLEWEVLAVPGIFQLV